MAGTNGKKIVTEYDGHGTNWHHGNIRWCKLHVLKGRGTDCHLPKENYGFICLGGERAKIFRCTSGFSIKITWLYYSMH